jgi:hypothetical protein
MKKIISLLSIIVVLSSCEKDVTVNIPKKDPKLVINALLPKDSVITVSIGKSRGVLEPTPPVSSNLDLYIVKNATAVVYENGTVLDTLVFDINMYRYVSPHQKTVKGGNTYSIKVTAPGFAQAEASTDVPSQSVIAEATRRPQARTNSDGNTEDEISLKLNDPAEANFYLIQIFGAYGAPLFCVSTTDKDIEPIGENADPFSTENCYDGNSLLMKDANFNGKQKQVLFYVNSFDMQAVIDPNGQVHKPGIIVSRITEAYFKFVKSYNVYYNSSDNPFAEPSNVYTNVKNGYGVFAVYTQAEKDL